MTEVKQEVRQFYDEVGWSLVGADVYQNARYEDLRPVSRRYIHDCHLRVARHLQSSGRYLLDAGSGPVQYPEYLEYSRGYRHRVCADISITALKEARRRLGEHGLFVVADIANLPFKPGVFEGVVSLHTIHHLPEEEHLRAYHELYRVLTPASQAVVVNGWAHSRLMRFLEPLIRAANALRHWIDRLQKRSVLQEEQGLEDLSARAAGAPGKSAKTPKGTFTRKHDAAWIKAELGAQMPVEIRVWRSVTVRFLRALIHPALGGRAWLRLLYGLEERFPHFFGENGKYPMIIIRKGNEAG
jgi:SAM-dependent methyltransferase